MPDKNEDKQMPDKNEGKQMPEDKQMPDKNEGKQMSLWMAMGIPSIVFFSSLVIKPEWFSIIASTVSIMALVSTLIFYIFSKSEDLKKEVTISWWRRIILEPIVSSSVLIIIVLPIYIHPRSEYYFNWLGSVTTLIAFLLGFIFFRYGKESIKNWWDKHRRIIQLFIMIMGIIYFIIPIVVYYHTIIGRIDFKGEKHIAEIKLIKEEDKVIASTKTDENGKFVLSSAQFEFEFEFEYPFFIKKKNTELLITYDPELLFVRDSDFPILSEGTLCTLCEIGFDRFCKRVDIVDNDCWHKSNKINYNKDTPSDPYDTIEIHNTLAVSSLLGKWICSLKNSPTKFIWKIDHCEDGIIIRQKGGEKTPYYGYFKEKKFSFNKNSYYFLPTEKTDFKLDGIVEKGEFSNVIKINLMDRNIISCLPCSR